MVKPDQVMIQKVGGYNLISLQEFQAISLRERSNLILEGKVQFLKDGKIMPIMEALKSLEVK